ncbi:MULTISPECIES: Ecr family regulatory small membrane protein [Enterobacteriaceae]|nr:MULTISPECIES: Ecr family regulatory small membrane protein [Enterobacteriaceae]UJD94824.1 Ecr family regulatory small membrane protein [Lelliottia amnigena]
MEKTEVILILIILVIIIFGLWFIFSGQMWHLAAFLENWLYPSIDAP